MIKMTNLDSIMFFSASDAQILVKKLTCGIIKSSLMYNRFSTEAVLISLNSEASCCWTDRKNSAIVSPLRTWFKLNEALLYDKFVYYKLIILSQSIQRSWKNLYYSTMARTIPITVSDFEWLIYKCVKVLSKLLNKTLVVCKETIYYTYVSLLFMRSCSFCHCFRRRSRSACSSASRSLICYPPFS